MLSVCRTASDGHAGLPQHRAAPSAALATATAGGPEGDRRGRSRGRRALSKSPGRLRRPLGRLSLRRRHRHRYLRQGARPGQPSSDPDAAWYLRPTAKLFDLVVVDGASQSSIASVLPLVFRARRALIIDDPMQLSHIPGISPEQGRQARVRAGLSAAWLEDRRLAYHVHSSYHATAQNGDTAQAYEQLASAAVHADGVHIGAWNETPALLLSTEISLGDPLTVHALHADGPDGWLHIPDGTPATDIDLPLENKNPTIGIVKPGKGKDPDTSEPGYQVRPDDYQWFQRALARVGAAGLTAFAGDGESTAALLTTRQDSDFFQGFAHVNLNTASLCGDRLQ
jgi:hypothetical protein